MKYIITFCIYLDISPIYALEWTSSLGGAIGTIKKEGVANTKTFSFGGLQFSLGVYEDLDLDSSYYVQGIVLLDIVNDQVAMNGIEGAYLFSLFGGPYDFEFDSKSRAHSNYNLSFGPLFSLINYSAVNSEDIKVKVEGQTIELHALLYYRFFPSSGLSLAVPLLGFPTTSQRVFPSMFRLQFFFVY